MRERMPKVNRFDALVATSDDDRPVARRKSTPYVVGGADDVAERRADAVADRGMARLQQASVMQLPRPVTTAEQRIRRSTAGSTIGRDGGAVDESFAGELDAAVGHGRPIEPETRQDIHRAIGHDVSDVRIHTDANADGMARRIQASAFTVDRDIFFAAGQYRPDTATGMHTLLHESGHLTEHGGAVRRRTIRRKISTTTFDLDTEFPQKAGPMASLRNAVTPSGDIAKLRDALKTYHAGASKPPTDKKQAAALRDLIKYADEWLRKHPQAKAPEDRRRIDLVDTIRTEAGLEFAKSQAAEIYMGDAMKSADQQTAAKSGGKVAAPMVPKSGPGSKPLANLSHPAGFEDRSLYKNRASLGPRTAGGKATSRRNERVAAGELAPMDPSTEAAMTAALESLSPAEFAALHTYTGKDYEYINPNVGGWGIGDFKDGAKTDDKTRQANRTKYEEAGLHGGFIASAMRKLPVWQGTTYKGLTMDADYLGLTTKGMYQANDYWSTSESKSQSINFLPISASTNRAMGKKVTKAVFCTVKVSNGRDVSRLSDAPQELEILLPPGSRMQIGKKQCFLRGKDDKEIRRIFGDVVLDEYPTITEFWLVDITQHFSDGNDVVGAYQAAGKTTPWAPAAKSGAGAPIAGGGGSRFNR